MRLYEKTILRQINQTFYAAYPPTGIYRKITGVISSYWHVRINKTPYQKELLMYIQSPIAKTSIPTNYIDNLRMIRDVGIQALDYNTRMLIDSPEKAVWGENFDPIVYNDLYNAVVRPSLLEKTSTAEHNESLFTMRKIVNASCINTILPRTDKNSRKVLEEYFTIFTIESFGSFIKWAPSLFAYKAIDKEKEKEVSFSFYEFNKDCQINTKRWLRTIGKADTERYPIGDGNEFIYSGFPFFDKFVEERFDIGNESALGTAVFLLKSGKYDQALAIFKKVFSKESLINPEFPLSDRDMELISATAELLAALIENKTERIDEIANEIQMNKLCLLTILSIQLDINKSKSGILEPIELFIRRIK